MQLLLKYNVLRQTLLMPTARQDKLLVAIGGSIIGLACLLHILIGANPIVVCSAGLTAFLSIYPIAIYGFLDTGAVLIALVGFRYVGFPLIAKLFMGQALDTNLLDSKISFNVVLVGILGYLAAMQLAKRLTTGKPVLQFVSSKAVLTRISVLAAIIGISANFSVALRVDEHYTGLTIGEFFVPFLHLALISAIAKVIQGSKGKKIIDWWVVILSMFELAFAIMQNSRMALMDIFLCFLISIISFKVKVKWRQVAATVCTITIMIVFVTPIFLGVRDFREDLSGPQRIDATLSMIKHWPDAYAYYQKKRDTVDRLGWYLNYYGSPHNVFERMSLINHVDVLASGCRTFGRIGNQDLRLSLKRAMPRILAPDKPIEYGHGSWLYEQIGLFGLGPFATAPLIGTGYAAFGWSGAFFYPLLLGLFCFLIIKKISGWDLQSNVWAIYLLIRVHNQFVEGSSDAYILSILRSLPQDLVLLWIIEAVARGRFLHSRYRKIALYYLE